MTTPAELLRSFTRTRASLDGDEVTYWWSGDVYSWAPDEPYQRVFGFEGLNVARLVQDAEAGPDAYRLLTREAAFYLDPADREILETWQDLPVVHIWNDPANQKWRPFPIPTTELGGQVCFSLEIPLAYPSPLPVAEYPVHSAGDTYRALELFQFFADRADLAGPAPSVPATMSWTRMSPWLPWMARGRRPGGLTFHCRGHKLGSYAEVPERPRLHRRPPPGVRPRPGAVERAERDQLDVLPQAQPAGLAPGPGGLARRRPGAHGAHTGSRDHLADHVCAVRTGESHRVPLVPRHGPHRRAVVPVVAGAAVGSRPVRMPVAGGQAKTSSEPQRSAWWTPGA